MDISNIFPMMKNIWGALAISSRRSGGIALYHDLHSANGFVVTSGQVGQVHFVVTTIFSKKETKMFEDHLCLFFILFHFFSTLLVSSVIVWSFESFFQHSFYPFLIILMKILNNSYRFSMIFLFPESRCHLRSVFLQRNALRVA